MNSAVWARSSAGSTAFWRLEQGQAAGEPFITHHRQAKICAELVPLTVDMETAAIAHVCYVNIIPFLAIRCITDTSEHSSVEYFEQNCKRASDIAKDITPPCSRSSAGILFTPSETQTPVWERSPPFPHGLSIQKTASLPQFGREAVFEMRFEAPLACFIWRTRWPWSPAGD